MNKTNRFLSVLMIVAVFVTIIAGCASQTPMPTEEPSDWAFWGRSVGRAPARATSSKARSTWSLTP
jgi:hypothetical protein